MPALDGNQTSGKGSSYDAGGLSTLGPVEAGSLEAGNGLANQAVMTGSVAGSPVVIEAQGSDTNIQITLSPKGTGTVTVPALKATGTVTFTGGNGLNSTGIFNSGPFVTDGSPIIDAESVGALDTVGNGIIAAALFGGQIVSRGGAQTAAFTDTTDTAANILAQFGDNGGTLKIRILNTTADIETIAGGAGVTVSGNDTIAAGAYRDFLVTMDTVNTTVILTNLGTGTI